MDQRTGKLIMYKTLHPKNDVDRLYESREDGGRGLDIIEDNMNASIGEVEEYIKKDKWRKNHCGQ